MSRTTIRFILRTWWAITNKKRFRVQFYEDGRYSLLMTHYSACNYAKIFGGQVCVDYNKNLKP